MAASNAMSVWLAHPKKGIPCVRNVILMIPYFVAFWLLEDSFLGKLSVIHWEIA